MDGATLQQKIYAGYARGAGKVGLPYQLFRAVSAVNPMAGAPLATLSAAFSAEDYRFAKPVGYGQAAWWGLFDGTQTRIGDMLVGPKTFFVAAQQALAPILVVEAPHIVDLRRPFRQSGVGVLASYGGTAPTQESVLMAQFPASILAGGKAENTGAELPDEVRTPGWAILLPAWPGVVILSSDVLKDELGRRFVVSSAELTPLGWRLAAIEEQA